jgi:membrane-associated phospholipid phosphatase
MAEVQRAKDERRTLGQLPANFGRAALGLWTKPSLTPLMVGSALAGLGSTLDQETAHPQGPGEDGLQEFSEAGATLGKGLVVGVTAAGLFAGGRFAHGERFRALTYDMLEGCLVNTAYTQILKATIRRQRPDGSNHKSFPSGHTSTFFTWATLLEHHYGWKAGIPAYAVAAAIGASRITQGSHYLSDVAAGATLGVIVGRTVARQNGRPRGAGSRFAFSPILGSHHTYGLSVSVDLE